MAPGGSIAARLRDVFKGHVGSKELMKAITKGRIC
jgi:hypothetical protein